MATIVTAFLRGGAAMARWVDAWWGYDVFIAHRRKDAAPYAEKLHALLTEEKISAFIDRAVYTHGDSLYVATRRHVSKSSVLVLLGSPELIIPRMPIDWVAEEIKTYLASHSHDPRIIVVDFGNTITNILDGHCPDQLPIEAERLVAEIAPFLRLPERAFASDLAPSDDVLDAARRNLGSRRRDRSRLRLFQGIAVGLTGLTAAAVFLAVLANTSADAARRNESRALAALAPAAAASSAWHDTLRLAIASWPRTGADSSRPMLQNTLDTMSASVMSPPVLASMKSAHSPTFSSDGRYIAVAEGQAITLIDVETGAPTLRIPPLGDQVRRVAISRDSRKLAMIVGNRIVLTDMSAEAALSRLPAFVDEPWNVMFSDNGKWLCVKTRNTVSLVDVDSNVVYPVAVPPASNGVDFAVFSPDGLYLAVGAGDHTILVDTTDRSVRPLPRFDTYYRGSGAFSADGRSLDVWSDYWVGSFDIRSSSRSLTRPRRLPSGEMFRAYSSDRRRLIVSRNATKADGRLVIDTLKLIDAANDRVIKEWPRVADDFASPVFSPNSRYFAVVAGRSLTLVDAESGDTQIALQPFDDVIREVVISSDSRQLAVATGNKIVLIDAISGAVVDQMSQALSGDNFTFQGLFFSPDGRRLISSSGGKVTLFDIGRRSATAAGRSASRSKGNSTFSSDGRTVAAWSGPDTKLVDVETGEQFSLPPAADHVQAVVFSDNGGRLAIYTDRSVTLIDTNERIPVDQYSSFPTDGMPQSWGNVRKAIFSTSGRQLAIQAGRWVQLINAATGQSAPMLESPIVVGGSPSSHEVKDIVFSPDGRRLVFRAPRVARLVEVPEVIDATTDLRIVAEFSLQPDADLPLNADNVRDVTFSQDGRLLACLIGRSVILADAATGKQRKVLQPFQNGALPSVNNDTSDKDAVFSAGGSRLIARLRNKLALIDTSRETTLNSFSDVTRFVASNDSGHLALLTKKLVGPKEASRLEDVVQFVDMADGTVLHEMPAPQIMTGVFSPGAKRFAYWDGVAVVLVDLSTYREAGRSTPSIIARYPSMRFSNDGKSLTLSDEGKLAVIDTASGRPIVQFSADAIASPKRDETPPILISTRTTDQGHILIERTALPIGEHMLEMACNRLPPHARVSMQDWTYGIEVKEPICIATPPPPDWARIERESRTPAAIHLAP